MTLNHDCKCVPGIPASPRRKYTVRHPLPTKRSKANNRFATKLTSQYLFSSVPTTLRTRSRMLVRQSSRCFAGIAMVSSMSKGGFD